jgi:hypothetical protein
MALTAGAASMGIVAYMVDTSNITAVAAAVTTPAQITTATDTDTIFNILRNASDRD